MEEILQPLGVELCTRHREEVVGGRVALHDSPLGVEHENSIRRLLDERAILHLARAQLFLLHSFIGDVPHRSIDANEIPGLGVDHATQRAPDPHHAS